MTLSLLMDFIRYHVLTIMFYVMYKQRLVFMGGHPNCYHV